MNMNELVQVGGVSPSALPTTAFKTSTSFYTALADMHMAHLSSQRNNAVESAEDCKRKYISRCLFRKLAREGRFCTKPQGPFKLFCDDFRPANVLTDSEFRVTGAVDWEFTYTAPEGLPTALLSGFLSSYRITGLTASTTGQGSIMPGYQLSSRFSRRRKQKGLNEACCGSHSSSLSA